MNRLGTCSTSQAALPSSRGVGLFRPSRRLTVTPQARLKEVRQHDADRIHISRDGAQWGPCTAWPKSMLRHPPLPCMAHAFMHQSTQSDMQGPGVSASWTQTTDDVLIKVPVPPSTKGRDLKFDIHPKRLNLALDGNMLLGGSLNDVGEIKVDGGWIWGVGTVSSIC